LTNHTVPLDMDIISQAAGQPATNSPPATGSQPAAAAATPGANMLNQKHPPRN